jgi:hypothetical protein
MRDLLRGRMRKPGRRIAPEVEELESRRVLSAAGLLNLTVHPGLHLAVGLDGGQLGPSALRVMVETGNLTIVTTPRAAAGTLITQPPAAVELGRLSVGLLEPQTAPQTEVVINGLVAVKPVALVTVETEPVIVALGNAPGVAGTPSGNRVQEPVPGSTSLPGPILQVVSPVPTATGATASAGSVVAVTAEGAQRTAVPAVAAPAVLSAGRATAPTPGTPRAAGATPIVLVSNLPAAVPVTGGAPTAVNPASAGVADTATTGRALTRAPESGGGNAREAPAWPPDQGAAGATEGGKTAGTAVPETAADSSGWAAVLDATFVQPMWDGLRGGGARGSDEQPAASTDWANPVAAAAALAMLLGAYWGGQSADAAPKRRQYFRQL